MEGTRFDSIINFAIQREKEAVQFYKDLQDQVKFLQRKEFLKSLEEMEKGHVTILENLKKKEIDEIKVSEVKNLKINDYLVESAPTETLSYQDILIIGMKKEQTAYELYTTLAEESSLPDIKKVFQKLASEEAKHKLFFETIYDEDILKEN